MENKSNENKLNFVRKVALEYRLSLFNICRLMRIQPTKENMKLVYDDIFSVCKAEEEQRAFNWLMSETINEPQSDSSVMYNMALFYLGQVTIAQNSGDKKQLDDAYVRLFRTDHDFQNLKNKLRSNDVDAKMNPGSLTQKDMLIIAKYRLKYALAKSQIAAILGINRETVSRNEKKHLFETDVPDNQRWINKLDKLNNMILSERDQRLIRDARKR